MRFTVDFYDFQISSKLKAIFGAEFFGCVKIGNEVEPQIGSLNADEMVSLRDLTEAEIAQIEAILYAPDAAAAAAWGAIRAERDALLAACDWRVLPDAPGDAAPWLAYRQALRDLPQTFSDPAAIVWPTPPPN